MTLHELGIDKLTVDERLDLIGQIWDSIVDSESPVAVPEHHRAELERRLAEADENPSPGVPWEELRVRLLGPR